mgnify:CR=1 FL=1
MTSLVLAEVERKLSNFVAQGVVLLIVNLTQGEILYIPDELGDRGLCYKRIKSCYINE